MGCIGPAKSIKEAMVHKLRMIALEVMLLYIPPFYSIVLILVQREDRREEDSERDRERKETDTSAYSHRS